MESQEVHAADPIKNNHNNLSGYLDFLFVAAFRLRTQWLKECPTPQEKGFNHAIANYYGNDPIYSFLKVNTAL